MAISRQANTSNNETLSEESVEESPVDSPVEAPEETSEASTLITIPPVIQGDILLGLIVTDYVVVSSKRIGRSVMEYVLKLKISNSSSTRYENVFATLLSAPAHVNIIDAAVVVGDSPPNSTILSAGTFTVEVDLALSTSFDDFVWQIEGDVITTPPPTPGDGPAQAGFFMNIDDNLIKGESTSASHKDWIVLTSIMEGLHRDNTGAGIDKKTFFICL